jgi:hypothetical protein
VRGAWRDVGGTIKILGICRMKTSLDRRPLLKAGTMAAGSLVSGCLIPKTASLALAPQNTAAPTRFDHRGYLGWITDLATDADSHA